jgi:hypothetical protein
LRRGGQIRYGRRVVQIFVEVCGEGKRAVTGDYRRLAGRQYSAPAKRTAEPWGWVFDIAQHVEAATTHAGRLVPKYQ